MVAWRPAMTAWQLSLSGLPLALLRERAGNFLKNALPVICARLPEQTYRRIPGRIVAVEQPSPIRRERQQQPRRLAQRAGKMHGRVVDGDHQIAGANQRRQTVDVAVVIDLGEMLYAQAMPALQILAFLLRVAILQIHEPAARHVQDRAQPFEGNAPVLADNGIDAVPGEPDGPKAAPRDLAAQMRDARSIGQQIAAGALREVGQASPQISAGAAQSEHCIDLA